MKAPVSLRKGCRGASVSPTVRCGAVGIPESPKGNEVPWVSWVMKCLEPSPQRCHKTKLGCGRLLSDAESAPPGADHFLPATKVEAAVARVTPPRRSQPRCLSVLGAGRCDGSGDKVPQQRREGTCAVPCLMTGRHRCGCQHRVPTKRWWSKQWLF